MPSTFGDLSLFFFPSFPFPLLFRSWSEIECARWGPHQGTGDQRVFFFFPPPPSPPFPSPSDAVPRSLPAGAWTFFFFSPPPFSLLSFLFAGQAGCRRASPSQARAGILSFSFPSSPFFLLRPVHLGDMAPPGRALPFPVWPRVMIGARLGQSFFSPPLFHSFKLPST